jgi:predicted SnoaL-like aldol condensation-catalyzing enzyme
VRSSIILHTPSATHLPTRLKIGAAVIAEGDKVVGRSVVTGTHQGEYMGLSPTGNSVTYDEIFVFRFVDGRIAETWGVVESSRRCGNSAQSRLRDAQPMARDHAADFR